MTALPPFRISGMKIVRLSDLLPTLNKTPRLADKKAAIEFAAWMQAVYEKFAELQGRIEKLEQENYDE